MFNRTFGLEFEHISKLDHYAFAELLTANRILIDRYATGHSRCPEGCYSGWQVKTDGSISVQEPYLYGVELVSPPLTFKAIPQIRKALELARLHGGVNSSCGLHVHVHAPELANYAITSGIEIRNMLETNWSAIESVLFSYVPLSRRSSDFCHTGINYSERYQALNLTPLGSPRRTVEFRLHSATLNPNKALSFVALCIAFVDSVVARKKLKKIDPTLKMAVQPKLIKTRKGGEFFLHRTADQWLIEAPKVNVTVPTLKKAFDEYKNDLSLTAKTYLPAFHYPHFGNAMTELCRQLNVNGIFRGYIEDRYDYMMRKYGAMNAENDNRNIVDDEADYYNEPDFNEREAA